MPVDMVLAIVYCNRRREYFVAPSLRTYEKRDERESREKLDNSFKNNNCIDMFRYW